LVSRIPCILTYPMKHTEAKAFVRKYNAELAIRGYSKMKKADLQKTIESKLSRSREELQREWSVLKAGPARPVAVKQGPRAGGPTKNQIGVKTPKPKPMAVKQGPRAGGPKKKPKGMSMTEWRDNAGKAAKSRKVSFAPKKPAAAQRAPKKPAAAQRAPKKPAAAQRSSENTADDAWHARNKDTSGQAQTNRLNAVTDRLTRRAAMQRDKERIRRIRGRR